MNKNKSIKMHYKKLLFLHIAVILFSGNMVYGQSTAFVGEEIRLTVTSSDVVSVVVRNEETQTTVHTGSADQNDPWTADTDDGAQGGVDADLSERTLYKLSFTSGSYSADYFYYSCPYRDAPSDERFFCPYDNNNPSNNDLIFEFDGSDLIVYPAGLQNTETPDVNDHFLDEFWMLPYNLDTYCIGIVTQCSGDQLGYFLTPQTGSTSVFDITDENLVATNSSLVLGYVWNWGEDITLEFPATRELIVYDTLFAENMTLTASGTNWGGVDFKDGSKAILTNVDILKVGTGAYTGSFTVRDGADVTIQTDSDNIVLGPNFKAELGSEFLATHVSSGSSAYFGPAPELTEDINQTSRKETQDISGKMSVAVESYPNPFNPSTTILYRLETDSHVVLKIYNILGQEVKTLVSEFQSAGSWESIWDGRNNSGSMVPSGNYIYRLEANGQSQIGQLALVK